MNKNYDVISVGGGPAGIFAALELAGQNLSILLIEKGKDIDERRCPMREAGRLCASCSPCSITCGLGGAGAFSDGKLTLSSKVGGHLDEYLGEAETEALVKYVDGIYVKYGAPERVYGTGEKVDEIKYKASLNELRLIPVPIRHMGTENCCQVLTRMRDELKSHIDLKLETAVEEVLIGNGAAKGVRTKSGEEYGCYWLVSLSRHGKVWFMLVVWVLA